MQAAKGVYRVRCDVSGKKGVARVEKVQDDNPLNERYRVRFFASDKRDDTEGEVVGVCWRYTPCMDNNAIPQYDGGWTRALALAEFIADGIVAVEQVDE